MTLYRRDLVRSLQRSIREEMRLHPAWKREARAARKAARREFSWLRLRWAVPAIFFVFAFFGEATLLGAVLGVWSGILAILRAAQMQSLFFPTVSSVFFQFPVTEEFVQRFGVERVVRSSLWVGLDGLAAFGGVLAAQHLSSPALWMGAVVAAALLWAVTLAVAIMLFWRWPGFPFGAVATGLAAVLIVGNFVRILVPAGFIATVASFAKSALPGGWIHTEFAALAGGQALDPFPLVLTATCLGGACFAVPQLRARFAFWEPSSSAQAQTIAEPAESRPVRVSEVEEQILGGDFLNARPIAPADAIQRRAIASLTARQRRIADALLFGSFDWTRSYLWGVASLLSALGIAAALSGFAAGKPTMITGGVLIAGLALMSPLFGGSWTAFQLAPLGSRFVALLSTWPISIRETQATILKLNFFRLLLALPWWVYAGAVLAWALHRPWNTGAIVGAQYSLLCFLLQPFWLIFKYSSGTNDTRSSWLVRLTFLFLSGVTLAALVAAGVGAFLFESWSLWLACAGLFGVLSFGSEVAYRRAYRAKFFDLLAVSAG